MEEHNLYPREHSRQENRKKRISLLREVLEAFAQEKISYCLLRNYEFLEEESQSPESLDMVVSREDFPRMEKVLREFHFHRRKQQFSLTHKAYFKFIGGEPVSFDVQVGGVHWNDLKYIDESILKSRVKKSFFYVPSDNDTFLMLLVHSILGKRHFKAKYQWILLSLYPKMDQNYVSFHLARIFNPRISKQLLNSVKDNQFAEIKPLPLVFYFLIKRFLRKPESFFVFTSLAWRWFRQRKNPFRLAPLISIVGPDGAGKSTLVSCLADGLQKSGRKISLVYTGRGRGHFLPITRLGKAYKRKEKKDEEKKRANLVGEFSGKNREREKEEKGKEGKEREENGAGGKGKRKLLYTLAAPVFTLDLLLRYWLRIFPQRLGKRIVITDRYCSDIILMENVPFAFKRFLLGFFPQPTVSVFLYNSPAVLHQRRPAESLAELERQLGIFGKFRYSLRLKTERGGKDAIIVKEFVLRRMYKEWW